MNKTRIIAPALVLGAFLTACEAATPKYPIQLVLLKELHSGGSPQGTVAPFMVAHDVTDDHGKVIVRAGTPAYGTVVWSRREGALSAPLLAEPARLVVRLDKTYDASNNPVALFFDTPDRTYMFTRQNTSEGDVDPAVKAAWMDPKQRAVVQTLVQNFTGEKPQPLSPAQTQLLVQQAKALALTNTAQLAQNGQLSALNGFVDELRASQSPEVVFGAAGPGVDVAALVAAVQEMAQLTRRSRGYIGGRFVGRNIVAPAGTQVEAYVAENP